MQKLIEPSQRNNNYIQLIRQKWSLKRASLTIYRLTRGHYCNPWLLRVLKVQSVSIKSSSRVTIHSAKLSKSRSLPRLSRWHPQFWRMHHKVKINQVHIFSRTINMNSVSTRSQRSCLSHRTALTNLQPQTKTLVHPAIPPRSHSSSQMKSRRISICRSKRKWSSCSKWK